MRQIRPQINAFLLALAGATVLMIGMGYGRFAFTGILPVMLSDQILTLRQGNLAASANYAGYLLGALLLAKAKPEQATRMNIVSVILTLICLALLAWLRSPLAIIILRGLAGVLSAVTLISASLWLLQHMKHHNARRYCLPVSGWGFLCRRSLLPPVKRWRLAVSKSGYCAPSRRRCCFYAPCADY